MVYVYDAGVHGIVNLPALAILLLLTALLIKGTQESATVNAIIVAIKVGIVIVFIAVGWHFVNPANHTPYMIPAGIPGHEGFFQHGYGGILGGAGIVFFAFIGFDAVSTAAQEAKDPSRDMPVGIMGSLAVCTILYILFGYVLTGVANYTEFAKAGKEASVAYAVQNHMPGFEWLATAITVAILFGFSSVILVMLLGQSRVFYTMATDGLLPKLFCDVHKKYCTPYKCNMALFLFVGAFAGFVPGDLAGDLTSIGTLFAFVLVCIGVIILRRSEPAMHRPFRTPLVPLVPILGMIVCGAMIVSRDRRTQVTALCWMLIGFLVYFAYGRSHSKLNTPEGELAGASR
jgi:APA family basic amino acid/polyamine antiporter